MYSELRSGVFFYDRDNDDVLIRVPDSIEEVENDNKDKIIFHNVDFSNSQFSGMHIINRSISFSNISNWGNKNTFPILSNSRGSVDCINCKNLQLEYPHEITYMHIVDCSNCEKINCEKIRILTFNKTLLNNLDCLVNFDKLIALKLFETEITDIDLRGFKNLKVFDISTVKDQRINIKANNLNRLYCYLTCDYTELNIDCPSIDNFYIRSKFIVFLKNCSAEIQSLSLDCKFFKHDIDFKKANLQSLDILGNASWTPKILVGDIESIQIRNPDMISNAKSVIPFIDFDDSQRFIFYDSCKILNNYSDEKLCVKN